MSRYKLTKEAIEYVCNHTNRFRDMERVRAICEMRMGGAKLEDIGREFKLSPGWCQNICEKVCRIYTYDLKFGKVGTTLYNRIKAMSLDEMASFFAYLYKKNILSEADRYICRKCRAENGGSCAYNECRYDLSVEDTIKLWLEGDNNEQRETV